MILFLFIFNFAMGFDLKPIHHEITKEFKNRLDKLETVEAWTRFIKDNPTLFAPMTSESPAATVVTSEELKMGDETFTIGTGHRQSFSKAKIENYKNFINTPELFQFAYGLDAPTKVNEPKNGSFLAHLQKKVPGIEDQDFTLAYSTKEIGNFYFIRASLVEDKKNFALRDNLKVLERVPGGVIAREVAILYPLRWYVRAFRGTMMKIVKEEMTRAGLSEKCITESAQPVSPEVAKTCWQKSQ